MWSTLSRLVDWLFDPTYHRQPDIPYEEEWERYFRRYPDARLYTYSSGRTVANPKHISEKAKEIYASIKSRPPVGPSRSTPR